MKVTLAHIGAVSMGRLLSIWSFVLGMIMLVLWGLFSIVIGIIGLSQGTNIMQVLIGIFASLAMGVVGLVVFAIAMFIFGFLSATVYNIILRVGGGIDIDLNERS